MIMHLMFCSEFNYVIAIADIIDGDWDVGLLAGDFLAPQAFFFFPLLTKDGLTTAALTQRHVRTHTNTSVLAHIHVAAEKTI